ncbi:MAG: CDP-alcohol phosphatidyltransferase family protein [Deltaproteobacteria bacterium]|nr:CDP-alcohol phosphatidyltransferase family protein [Deltaproteobacteria bacterium]MBI3295032.1 CDP-alcohol phosphatidyltransferase family protein [Deltaproteobacteria bacterium]
MRQVPNILSILRLLLTPLTLTLLLQRRYREALLVHALCGFTDFVDGFLARRYHWESRLGSFLDAASDKLYTLSIFCTLTYLGHCPTWYLALLITLSLLQSTAVLILQTKNRSKLAPSFLGKAGMTAQFVWAGVMILDLWANWLNPLTVQFICGAIAALLVVAFIRYFLQFRSRLLPIASTRLAA